MNTIIQDQKAIIAKNYIRKWDEHDEKNIGDLFSDEAIYTDPVRSGIAKQVVPQFLMHSVAIFPNMRFNIITLISSEENK